MKKFLISQSAILFAGVIFSWTTVAFDFAGFFDGKGINPLTTPCFYGAIGFFLSYLFSLYILFSKEKLNLKLQKYLVIFLIAGTLFGWGNFVIELCKFYIFRNPTSCSGAFTSTPFLTPCFFGSLIYLLSFIISFISYKSLKKG